MDRRPLKKGCENTIIPVMRHCRMQCASGRREGRGIFTRQEYMLFFKVEEYYSVGANTLSIKNV
jgi:hypothetical protein